jgi:hypothetical protein
MPSAPDAVVESLDHARRGMEGDKAGGMMMWMEMDGWVGEGEMGGI